MIFLLALLEGLAVIVSPCILPILPILLAQGLSTKSTIGLILGFCIVFSVVTMCTYGLVQGIDLPINTIQMISYGIILLSSVFILSDTVQFHVSNLLHKITPNPQIEAAEGVISGMVLGGCLSLVWTPCAGPILVSVIAQISAQEHLFQSMVVLGGFSVGVVAPLLGVCFISKSILQKYRKMSRWIYKGCGVLILLTVLYQLYQLI